VSLALSKSVEGRKRLVDPDLEQARVGLVAVRVADAFLP